MPGTGQFINQLRKKAHSARACRQKDIYQRKIQNVTEEDITAVGKESDQSEATIYRIEILNRITDKNKCQTSTVKVNGIETYVVVDTGSPISIVPVDENISEKTEIQKVRNRCQDVCKNEVKFRGQIPADFEYENNKQKIKILIIKRTDITPLLGMDWMKKINVTIRNIRLNENNQSQKRRVIEKFPDLFKSNTTIKDTDMKIKLMPGHYLVKQKTRPMPLDLQEEVGEELEKLMKTGHVEKVKHVDEDSFVLLVVITVKSDKSIKITIDSRKFNDS